jgi:hypothetical protein
MEMLAEALLCIRPRQAESGDKRRSRDAQHSQTERASNQSNLDWGMRWLN